MYIVLDSWTASRGERLVSIAGKYWKNEIVGGRLEALIPVRRVGGADIRRYEAQFKAAKKEIGGDS
jgi:hypothetical protein